MADWFVYQPDGAHLGPFSTELIAAAIVSSRLSRQAWLGPPGGSRWLRALDVPVIASLLASYPVNASGNNVRVVASLTKAGSDAPPFHSTVVMVTDEEISDAFEATMMVTDEELSVISEPEAPPPGVPTQRGLPDPDSEPPPSRGGSS